MYVSCLILGATGKSLQATWGGSPMRAADGTYHLFFSWFRMPDNGTQPSIKEWYLHSVVAHATSQDSALGPYKFVGEVFPPRGGTYFDGTTTHNPTIVRLPDDSFALFYIGLNCNLYGANCLKRQSIGAAHAASLDGMDA